MHKLLLLLTAAAIATPSDISHAIAGLNDRLQIATRTNDGATIRKLITSDFTLITANSRIMSSDDVVADVSDKSVVWYNNDSEDVRVRSYNGDCAVVTATLHQRYRYEGKIADYRVRFTDTWVKLGGTWRYVAGHASMLKRYR